MRSKAAREYMSGEISQFSTRIPKQLHKDIKAAAIEDELPLGLMQFVREALEEKLKRRKK